ncbi:MAG TPA: tyrosine-type recombinase/integrase [Anaerolineae bacterium]|nr:tyrosine-type recombinase/integrase [Anaerolineae bacterium]
MSDIALATRSPVAAIMQAVLDSVGSEHTRRAYERALSEFFVWHEKQGRPKLERPVVQRYVSFLRGEGVPPSSINQRLSAIRRMVREAVENGALSNEIASGIISIQGAQRRGKRAGNWLTKDEAQELLRKPNVNRRKGLRDRAILAVLIGCGLRREEAAGLTLAHIQQRDGRWVIVDLLGKRNKVRSVPMPNWTKSALDAWTRTAGIIDGAIFRAMDKGGKVAGETLTAQAIRNVVVFYSSMISKDVAPHDLRRTYAKLAHKGGSALDQIQLSLGHDSIKTTETYLGVDQDLTDAPCDHIGLQL